MEVSFFNAVVDVCIVSLRERTEMMSDVTKKFGVLISFPKMSLEELRQKTKDLCNTLTSGSQCDLNNGELILEMQYFPPMAKQNMTTLELLVFLEEKNLKEIYPNLWIALRIAVTTPVTVASAERSFSKLKLIKTYLRSSMSQERLNGLAIISIKGEMSKQVSYDETINAFVACKTRRVTF